MHILTDQIIKTLLPGMYLPKPLELLLAWIEDNDLCVQYDRGRMGYLFPEERVRSALNDAEIPGGTMFRFIAEGNDSLGHWFGNDQPEIVNRLCVFGFSGCEGSRAAFWLDDDGRQKIVHMGSGSGSTMVCVLADDPIDFLRLLAIGYDEICWPEKLSKPPNADRREDEPIILPNLAYQEWVRKTFSVSIPRVGTEIVKHPAEMGDKNPPDPFCRWVEQNAG